MPRKEPEGAPLVTARVSEPQRAATLLRDGQLVAFPTETVYGLGARCDDDAAVRAIYRAKGRPDDNPLIVHIGKLDMLSTLSDRPPMAAYDLLDAFAPGPITVIVPASDQVSRVTTAGLPTVGIRIPEPEPTREMLSLVGVGVAAPSANRSGRPSPTTVEAVLEDLDGRIHGVLTGAPSRIGIESSIVDLTTDPPLLLRPGAICLSQIQSILPAARALDPRGAHTHRAPGLRHRHYAPRAAVSLIDPDEPVARLARDEAYISTAALGIHPNAASAEQLMVYPTAEALQQDFFEALRRCDRAGFVRIIVRKPPPASDGLAGLLDRMERAAGRS